MAQFSLSENRTLTENDPASAATDPGHGPTTPTTEKAMDVRSDNTEAAAAASDDASTLKYPWVRTTTAADILWEARTEAMLMCNFFENELVDDPKAPGFSYSWNADQARMASYIAHLTLCSIDRAIKALEART